MILAYNRKHVDAWRGCRAEHFDDFALGIYVARLPIVEAHYDFVANCTVGRRTLAFSPPCNRPDINVVHETRIIRHHVIKIPRSLQRADDRVVSTFEDSNHPSFTATLYPPGRRLRRYAHNDTISVHRCTAVFRRNENVGLT